MAVYKFASKKQEEDVHAAAFRAMMDLSLPERIAMLEAIVAIHEDPETYLKLKELAIENALGDTSPLLLDGDSLDKIRAYVKKMKEELNDTI